MHAVITPALAADKRFVGCIEFPMKTTSDPVSPLILCLIPTAALQVPLGDLESIALLLPYV